MRTETRELDISPEEWGTTIQLMDQLPGAHRREIREAQVRLYAKDIERIAALSRITFVVVAGILYVIDGQHRLKAALELCGVTLRWTALLIWLDDGEDVAKEVAQIFLDMQKGTRANVGDKLKIFSGGSIWPSVFANAGLNPGWRQGTTRIQWAAIMRGYGYFKSMTAKQRIGQGGFGDSEKILDLWLTATEEEAEWCAYVILWWEEGAKIARHQGVNSLRGYLAVAWAYLVMDQNAGLKRLGELPKKIAEHRALPRVKGLTGGAITLLFNHYLEMGNYRNSSHLVSVFGDTGRDPE